MADFFVVDTNGMGGRVGYKTTMPLVSQKLIAKDRNFL